MNRLLTELRRLFLCADPTADQPPGEGQLFDGAGRTRALVLELARPADWARLGEVWRGVQTELDLPAPAIAVNGVDGFQLWFALAEAVTPAEGQAFLQGLVRRWLADLPARRVDHWPRPADPGQPTHAAPVPSVLAGTGLASAFVAPDLAPVCADEPWLDVAPSPDAQAELLARLQPVSPARWAEARARLLTPPAESAPSAGQPGAAGEPGRPADTGTPAGRPGGTGSGPVGPFHDPRDFLRAVMNDASLPLASRLEAARTLLAAPADPSR